MAKTYRTPEQKQETEESKHRKPGEIYDQPERTGPSRQMLIAVAIIIALLAVFIFYRMSRGEDLPGQTSAFTLQSLQAGPQATLPGADNHGWPIAI